MSPRVQKAYRLLLRDLDTCHFPPRSLLPPSRELCGKYDVSRPTLGKAISLLVQEDRLQSRQGAGTIVLPHSRRERAHIVSCMAIMNNALVMHAQHRALELGYVLNIFLHQETEWDPRIERRFLERVREQKSHALLAFCSPLKPANDDMLQAVADSGVRVIHTEHYRIEPPDQEYLMPDYAAAGRLAARYLLESGCTSLRVLGHWTRPSPSSLLTEIGVAQGIAEAGARPAERMLLATAPDYESGLVARRLAALPAQTGLIYPALESGAKAIWLLRSNHKKPDTIKVVALSDTLKGSCPWIDRFQFDTIDMHDRIWNAVNNRDDQPLRELLAPTFLPASVPVPQLDHPDWLSHDCLPEKAERNYVVNTESITPQWR